MAERLLSKEEAERLLPLLPPKAIKNALLQFESVLRDKNIHLKTHVLMSDETKMYVFGQMIIWREMGDIYKL